MNLKTIKSFIFFVVVFFASANFVFADFEITEIMYDQKGTDANREWIEVKNTGSNSEDLSKWFIFTDNVKHALIPQGESMVPADHYAVIVQNVPQFNLDYPNFQGLLFDSSWTDLNNKGETISLKNPSLDILSQISYSESQGGNGNSNSLSLINGIWQNGTPTPGKDNQAAIVVPAAETAKPAQKAVSAPNVAITNQAQSDDIQKILASDNSQIINLNDLGAGNRKEIQIPNFIFPLGLFVIIGLGIGSFLLVNKKNKIADYEEGIITADDITIVE